MNQQTDESADRFAPRIEAIETQWSMVRRAHQGTLVSGGEAKQTLVMRYASSIKSYVRAMTGSEHEADELSQDVMVRILQGDFAGADPNRGRFRDLLKVAVRNMVKNHWAKQNRRKTVDWEVDEAEQAAGGTEDDPQDPWLPTWRHNLLEHAWNRLEQFQAERPGNIAYTLLKLRSEFPQDDSPTLAQRLSDSIGKEVRPDTTRQNLRRARLRFAEFLVEEIAEGLDSAEPARIQEELIALGLYESIRDVLPEKWTTAGGQASQP